MTESLLNVDWVIEQIVSTIERLPAERVDLADAYGRVLAQDVVSDVDLPPFPYSSMDGYALNIDQASAPAGTRFAVMMDIPAGAVPTGSLSAGQAARIMTGAPIPDGANAVVAVENTDDNTWQASGKNPLPPSVTITKAVALGANIRPVGENIRRGEPLLSAGTILKPQDVGMLASVGMTPVPVVRRPRIAVMTSGDELIDPSEPLTPGKIRNSNSVMVAGLIQQCGGVPIILPVAKDTLADVQAMFETALSHHPDMFISTAGVSVGTADYVRAVVEALGELTLWRINLRPGKPLAFGRINGKPFFGLPGNPVSAIVTFDVIARPAIMRMVGVSDTVQTVTAITTEDMPSDGRRSYIRVRLRRVGGELHATPTGNQSSGALMSVVRADGLAIIPENVTFVPAGTPLVVRLLREVGMA